MRHRRGHGLTRRAALTLVRAGRQAVGHSGTPGAGVPTSAPGLQQSQLPARRRTGRRRVPQAKTVMAYSQSSDPLSPHHNDQTELSSRKEWVTERFCDVDRHTVSVPRLR
ncbi:penicillin acylase family protein [Actinokineospora sp. HBU206404]|uniref:Penicillin acylase family protein n=1 Tax=Actinokineospora xionganensis TaxID=2684470 RepID=A0ABR7LFT7_9PSEU|nr:penicillin acylase family protein [Actinokineospora xionganensis]MBC6451560.1 penicillin acylase family protein [Actinokineospora xionganensis]